MDDLDSLFSENLIKVKIFDIEQSSDFACAVVLHAGSAAAVSAVGEVELVTVSPGTALLYLRSLVSHVAAGEVVFDHAGDRTVFDERGQDFDGKSEKCRNACDVGLRAGDLHHKVGAAMERLTVRRSESNSHAGRNQKRISRILFQCK